MKWAIFKAQGDRPLVSIAENLVIALVIAVIAKRPMVVYFHPYAHTSIMVL